MNYGKINLAGSTQEPFSHHRIVERIQSQFVALNRYVNSQRLLQYQLNIFETGRFDVLDITSDDIVSCSGTFQPEFKRFAYRFAGRSGVFWLIAAEISQAYEIDAVFLEQERTVYLRKSDDPSIEPIVAALVRYLDSNNVELPPTPASARLVVGHPNFAHFIWNEMPALLDLEEREDGQVPHIAVTYEPILPFEKLIRWNSASIRVKTQVSEVLRQPAGYEPSVLFSLGSRLVTKKVKQRIVEECTWYAHQSGVMPTTRDRIVLWVSLRLLYRHPVNQLAAFIELFRQLSLLNQKFAIILDGYSLPHDLDFLGRYNADLERSHSSELSKLVQDLKDEISNFGTDQVTVIDGTQADLPTSIFLASHADFYVCHHGTQQHKIGWIYRAPGVIHANRHILETRPTNWTRNQTEDPGAVYFTPDHLISEFDNVKNKRRHVPYFADYEFTDPVAFADFVIETMRREAILP
jgi:hypothetical protein